MPHHILHGAASQDFFARVMQDFCCLENDDFNEPCKELKCTCECASAELPMLALALSAWQALVVSVKHCKSFLCI